MTVDNLNYLGMVPSMPTDHPASIEVEGLVREFKKGPRAVDGIDLARRARRDLRLPRAQRRRQVDDRPHAHDAAPADRGHGARRPASTSSARARRSARAIGAALQEAALDPFLTGREHMRLQSALHGIAQGRARRAAATSCSSGSA